MTTKRLAAVRFSLLALALAPSVASRAESSSTGDQKALFRHGAELWPRVCGTCHNARPGGERSPAEWDTIVMHMHTVANLPEGDAQAIMIFLKAR